MSGVSAPGPPAQSGLLAILRSWLRAWSREIWRSSEDAPSEYGVPSARSYSSVRVLVVDDNPVNLMLISALMESKGLVPLLAVDGAEAVALACEMHFDLILMDLQMPILDGLEATAAIRRHEAACSRPAVPVVAYSSTHLGAHVLATHGMNGSLAKPCDDQDLEECLVRWCPTYHSQVTVRRVPCDDSGWQAVSRSSDSSSASLG